MIKDDRVTTSLVPAPLERESAERDAASIATLVACPDARPPAYQAVVGLAKAGMLDRFLTGFYYGGDGTLAGLAGKLALGPYARVRKALGRRHEPEIPAKQVRAAWSFDVALAAEAKLAKGRPGAKREVARWRTRRFDRALARMLERRRPDAALIFSDVGSEFALPACRELGIATVLSMVHGDVREEREVLRAEREHAPDFFPIYLGDGPVDEGEMAWLHERRLRDIALADRILVPSEHIAGELEKHGTPRERIEVIPYAADTRRFVPMARKTHREGSCTFLFAGGITQRKGIKYLLEAWRRARRPGWRLQLLGALPCDPGPLRPYLDEVELLGRVPHGDVTAVMAAADVFVFPSLFEGSAVVTYEALACGLPSVVTPAAGSVARDGVEGLVVPSRDVEALAAAMERLGTDPALRASLAAAARTRAEAFDWPRYHGAVEGAVRWAARQGRGSQI